MVRTLLFASTLLLFSISCKKEIRYELFDINLRISEIINDSTIRLTWNALPENAVEEYRLLSSWQGSGFTTHYPERDTLLISPQGHSQMTQDVAVPLANSFTYYLEVAIPGGIIRSNEVNYVRKQGLFPGTVHDVLADTVRKLAYVIDREAGKIIQFKYLENLIVREMEFPYILGYCSLGEFNGQPELYTPRADGWVDIFDAVSLQLKDRLYVGGFPVSSVVSQNHLLFVSTFDSDTINGISQPTKAFARDTKKLISSVEGYTDTRLFLLPGSQNELIGIVYRHPNQKALRYRFDGSSLFLSASADITTFSTARVADMTRISPNAKFFISGPYGSVHDSSLAYQSMVVRPANGQQHTFLDFAIDIMGSRGYCAVLNKQLIDLIDLNLRVKIGEFRTRLYPVKLFLDGKQLICVTASGSSMPGQLYRVLYHFEKFNL